MDPSVASAAGGTPWAVIFAVVAALAGAVSLLFGLLNARTTAQLAAAEKRATDEAAARAVAEKALADERKERLAYVEERRLESQAEREELQGMLNDMRMLARAQTRGGFRQGTSGGGAEGSGDTGPQPVRRPGSGGTR